MSDSIDLAALNSATKYPSIPTYHVLGERGALTEDATPFVGDVVLTEKIDGTNARIIQLPGGDWLIGSREELLAARGDRVTNPALGIVGALRTVAEGLSARDGINVFYLEVYGAKVGAAAKQYTGTGQVGYRLFDVATVPPEVLDRPVERISAWREGGGQSFLTEEALTVAAGVEGIALTPRLDVIAPGSLPTGVDGMSAWLDASWPRTRVALDGRAAGRAEGVVLRTTDRSVIAKARFEDYARTLKRRTRTARSG
ncbi:RNA ligase family protein [Streptomyces sp. NPDC059499]|uniref:RNA ligase family protein n=1 Tax=Streptomyces sp. NPDC059499 TaxID=3346852 RepID=UPI0036B743D1